MIDGRVASRIRAGRWVEKILHPDGADRVLAKDRRSA
jgi:hypothetical protein